MAKTYVPMAVSLAGGLHKRLTRYQATLTEQSLSEPQTAALVALIACLADFLVNWHKPQIQP